jgi:hypothetical protein
MKDIDVIVHGLESLNGEVKKHQRNCPPININRPDWLEEAKRQAAHINNQIADKVRGINDELISDWRRYSKQDILMLQETLERTNEIAPFIGIKVNELNENNLIDACFLLLLKSKHMDYRDCLLELKGIIDFANKNKIDYKNSGKQVSELFGKYEFHSYFDKAIL